MCERYGLVATWKELYEFLDLPGEPPEGGIERYNISPGRRVPVWGSDGSASSKVITEGNQDERQGRR